MPRSTAITPGTGPEGLEDWLEEICSAGVEAVQVREKQLSDRALLALSKSLVGRARGRLRILINGRADIVMAAGADGVHLPANGLPTHGARKLLGEGSLVGRSTHNLEEVAAAGTEGADFVFYSPVFETPGKGTAVGISGLSRAVASGVPVVALGGVSIERIGPVASTGAAGIAGIGMFARTARLGLLRAAMRQFEGGQRMER